MSEPTILTVDWPAYRAVVTDVLDREIGPCVKRVDLIDHIERAAQDFLAKPTTSPAETAARLVSLAKALRAADMALNDLGTSGASELAWFTIEGGIAIQEGYLTDLARAADDAALAVSEDAKSREDKRLSQFIYGLAWQVKLFGKMTPTLSYDVHYKAAPYGGKFFEIVQSCLEPLGRKTTNQALGKKIQRVLRGMDRSSGKI